MGKKVDCLKRSVRCGTVQRKINSPEIQHVADRNYYNNITLTQWDSVILSRIDKYRTGVLSITCDLLTDAISDWMSIVGVQAFCHNVFLCSYRRIQSVIQFFLVWPLWISFRQCNKSRMLLATVSNGWVFKAVHLIQFRSRAIFCGQTFHKVMQ